MSDADRAVDGSGEVVDVVARLSEGRQTFLGFELLCGPGALVPRPETELLGQLAIDQLRDGLPGAQVVDMCCGAGNLACAIALSVPSARVWASDLTDGCIEWTRRNVAKLALGDRVEVAQGDLFEGLRGKGLEGKVDVVVCNPPYISTGRLATDRSTLLTLEPREAFDGGPYGLSVHQRVMKDAVEFLKPGGWLMMEFGLGQDRQVKVLLERTRRYDPIRLASNSAGHPRVVSAKAKPQ